LKLLKNRVDTNLFIFKMNTIANTDAGINTDAGVNTDAGANAGVNALSGYLCDKCEGTNCFKIFIK
jgi:hypothetical protein